MTQEQYDFLTKYKSNMETSVESGYSRNIRNPERKRIKEIYIELSGDNAVGNVYCMECLPDLLRKIKPYYDAGVSPEAPATASAGKARKTKEEKHGSEESEEAETNVSGQGEESAATPQGDNSEGGGEVPAGSAGGGLDS